MAAFATFETARTIHRSRLGGSAHVACTGITDVLKAMIEIVEGLCGPPTSGNFLPYLLLFNRHHCFFIEGRSFPFVNCSIFVVIFPT